MLNNKLLTKEDIKAINLRIKSKVKAFYFLKMVGIIMVNGKMIEWKDMVSCIMKMDQ